MQPVLKGGDDPEVATAATQAPEEVFVLRLARLEKLAVGRDYLGGDQVVAGEPVLPL